MSWVRVAAGHAKSSARTAAAPAPSRVDEVAVVDILNAGVAMGSADEAERRQTVTQRGDSVRQQTVLQAPGQQ